MKRAVFINPWIFDFSAYDFFAKPIGLLYLASFLKKSGFEVYYINCLKKKKIRDLGDGHIERQEVEFPIPSFRNDIKRKYKRYGIREDEFVSELKDIKDPDFIFVTSFMTYWYPGPFRVIELSKKLFPKSLLVLSGIYATLCYKHAKMFSKADMVIRKGDLNQAKLLSEIVGVDLLPFFREELDALPYPLFELDNDRSFLPILTSLGCPFRCLYCASPVLAKRIYQRDPKNVVKEIEYWHFNFSFKNFAFYDDALLFMSDKHIKRILKMVIDLRMKVNFVTPNALHVRWIDEEISVLMKEAGFRRIYLGLESCSDDPDKRYDKKCGMKDFEKATKVLKEAGFLKKELYAYILLGLPGQRAKEIFECIEIVSSYGVKPVLAEYSPIPNTPLFGIAKRHSIFDLNEPLFHNNTLLPCRVGGISLDEYLDIKRFLKEVRDRMRDF